MVAYVMHLRRSGEVCCKTVLPAAFAKGGCRGNHLPRLLSDAWMPEIHEEPVCLMALVKLLVMAACLPVSPSFSVFEAISIVLILDISMMQHRCAVSSQEAFGHQYIQPRLSPSRPTHAQRPKPQFASIVH